MLITLFWDSRIKGKHNLSPSASLGFHSHIDGLQGAFILPVTWRTIPSIHTAKGWFAPWWSFSWLFWWPLKCKALCSVCCCQTALITRKFCNSTSLSLPPTDSGPVHQGLPAQGHSSSKSQPFKCFKKSHHSLPGLLFFKHFQFLGSFPRGQVPRALLSCLSHAFYPGMCFTLVTPFLKGAAQRAAWQTQSPGHSPLPHTEEHYPPIHATQERM